MAQAIKGGQTGINGDFYKGGQFLPNSPETVKGAKKRPQTKGKRPVAPFKWEAAPTPNHCSIFDLLDCCGDGAFRWSVFGEQMELLTADTYTPARGFYVNPAELVAAFNRGERWIDMAQAELYEPRTL